MLFSEPKIPQSGRNVRSPSQIRCFSALQRAENSSIRVAVAEYARPRGVSVLFSEPKIPQWNGRGSSSGCGNVSVLFSEPKIPQSVCEFDADGRIRGFQCSSASRKFLNIAAAARIASLPKSFSALQRAENSSMKKCRSEPRWKRSFSALQRAENSSIRSPDRARVLQRLVSVLFSEPKIPQLYSRLLFLRSCFSFQCSSASRKFLNGLLATVVVNAWTFQCSSASRKFLN